MAKKKHETPRIVLRRQQAAPLQLRNEVGSYLPPGAKYDYKPPSVFAQHRVLTIVFALIVLIALAYWALGGRHDRAQRVEAVPAPAAAAAADEPVYVVPVQPR